MIVHVKNISASDIGLGKTFYRPFSVRQNVTSLFVFCFMVTLLQMIDHLQHFVNFPPPALSPNKNIDQCHTQGTNSVSRKTFHYKILQNLEAGD